MAFARILADGSGLLRRWTDLAPGQPPLSAAAVEELLLRLTRYYDATGSPLTVVFDAGILGGDAEETPSTNEVEVLVTRPGQTTAQVLRRLAYRYRPTGEVSVVLDESAQEVAHGSNGVALVKCADFIRQVETTLEHVTREIQDFNQQERTKFLRAS